MTIQLPIQLSNVISAESNLSSNMGRGLLLLLLFFLLRNDRRQNVELSYCNALEQIGGKSPRAKMM